MVLSLIEGALRVLNESDPWEKRRLTEETVLLWQSGDLPIRTCGVVYRAPDRPARSDDIVRVLPPWEMPKLGRGGTLSSRQAILHSLTHIESWAVDLAWDAIARFGSVDEYHLPRHFFDDFVKVASEECKHFSLLARRLEAVGCRYGALPAHDGLWESASATSHCLGARLAVEHCVHEARGLDVLPSTILKFENAGDKESASLLRDVIYPEEISHCAAGVRWLRHLHRIAHSQIDSLPPVLDLPTAAHSDSDDSVPRAAEGAENGANGSAQQSRENLLPVDASGSEDRTESKHGASNGSPPQGQSLLSVADTWPLQAQKHEAVEEWFHELIRAHFKGGLKPPFNTQARTEAGFTEEWYLPLVHARKPAPA